MESRLYCQHTFQFHFIGLMMKKSQLTFMHKDFLSYHVILKQFSLITIISLSKFKNTTSWYNVLHNVKSSCLPCCLWTCNSILVMKSMIYISCTGTKHGKSEKNESKQIENKHTSNVLHANTPENSPKRKRTRNTASSASPATPDVPPPKRRRWSQNLLSYSCCEGFFCVTDTCVQIWYAYKEKLFQL